jgi:SAM-dependent methyltransferase
VPVERDFAPAGPVRSLIYRLLWACAHVFHRAANACMFAAAGLLRREDLRVASRHLWRDYGTLLEDVDGGLEVWEQRMFASVLQPGDHILLVGCGAGRDLIALHELGYEVTGLDPTPELVEQARSNLLRRGMTARVVQGFVETAVVDGTYNVVVLAGNSYSFLPTSMSRIATLERIRKQLSAGGRVVITYTGAVRRQPFSIWLTRIVARLSGADWRPEPGDIFARDYFKRRLLRYEHMFMPGELSGECAAAGLRVVKEVRTSGYYVVAVPAT